MEGSQNLNQPAGEDRNRTPHSDGIPMPGRFSAGTYIVLVFMLLVFPAFNILLSFMFPNEFD